MTVGANEEKFSTEKISEGPITCIRLVGTIDESFDGQRLAASVRAKTLLLYMADVRRISSFGIREWSNFVKGVERAVDSIFLIDCSPKVVDQINMVANFAGKAQVYSFYGPYRCDYCDVDSNILFQVDRDAQDIRGLRPREELCESCGREQYFDEDPATFFSFVAGQAQFELPHEVADFLSTKLDYNITGLDRHLQIDKFVDGRYTFVRLSGNLDGSFPSEKLAEGLEGVVVVDVAGLGKVDLAGAAEWRNFVQLACGGAEQLYLLECPPLLLERLGKAEDLGDRVVSFSMPYSCATCANTTSQLIDVDEHHDILRFATPPEMKCAQCKQPTTCVASETLLSRLRSLTKPEVDSALRAFIKKAKKRKPPRQAAAEEARAGGSSKLMLVVVAGALLTTGGALAYNAMTTGELKRRMAAVPPSAGWDAGPTEKDRPAWITADTPSFAYCTDLISRMSCVGVSPDSASIDEGREEARNAALEELINAVSIKLDAPLFEEHVRPQFADARRRALLAFDEVRGDRQSAEYERAYAVVQSARRRAAEAAIATGGQAMPVQQSGWYWEQYVDGQEYRVFVRYDISLDAVRRLVETYTEPKDVGRGKVVTGFPLLAWAYPTFEGGVQVVESGSKLEDAGAALNSIIESVDGTPVRTAGEMATAFGQGKKKSLSILTTSPASEEEPADDREGDEPTEESEP